jgi:hypothetical protein
MDQLVRTHSIFLDSAAGSSAPDEPAAVVYDIEPNLIKCSEDETMCLTLERFHTVHNWPWIPEGTFVRVFGDTSVAGLDLDIVVLLAEGNPTVAHLACNFEQQVRAQLPDGALYEVRYASNVNRFAIRCDRDLGLRFPDLATARLMGFDALEVAAVPTMTDRFSLESTLPIQPLPIDSIRLDVRGVSVRSHNATNLAQRQVGPTACIAMMPVTSRPWTLFTHVNDSGSFRLVLNDRALTRLTLVARDWGGRPLTELGQYYVSIRVDVYRNCQPRSVDDSRHAETLDRLELLLNLGAQQLAELRGLRALETLKLAS